MPSSFRSWRDLRRFGAKQLENTLPNGFPKEEGPRCRFVCTSVLRGTNSLRLGSQRGGLLQSSVLRRDMMIGERLHRPIHERRMFWGGHNARNRQGGSHRHRGLMIPAGRQGFLVEFSGAHALR